MASRPTKSESGGADVGTLAEEAEYRGLLLRDAGDFEGAKRQFQKAFQLTKPAPLEPSTWARRAMLLGEALSIVGRFAEADERYGDALEGDATEDAELRCVRLNTWRLRSALRLAQGRLSEARRAIDEAARLAPAVPATKQQEHLDLQLQIAFVAEAEGQFAEAAPVDLANLIERYAALSGPAGTRGQAYCRLLSARIAIARQDLDEAVSIAEDVVRAAQHDRSLRRVLPQALHASGEAHLAAADFNSALTAFEECAKKCVRDGQPLPHLRRVFIDANLGIAAARRSLKQPNEGHRQLVQLAKTIESVEDAAPHQVKYLLALGMSYVELALNADGPERRAELSVARSALRKAELVRLLTDGTEQVGIQICTTLSFVQRALGRPRQATATLENARPLVESLAVPATDRADFLSALASSLLRDADDAGTLDRAERNFQEARRAYSSWYDLARTDHNLALVEVQRADIARAQGHRHDEQRHLSAALDRLIPALLAKFAVRFTLMSQKHRQNWNTQQARGFEVAVNCAMRLHDTDLGREGSSTARLVADLVLIGRIQGVLTPASSPASSRLSDELAPEPERAAPFADNIKGGRISPATADLIGVGDQPSLLAPAPRLLGPDGRVVLEVYFERARELYERRGLPADRLYRPGCLVRL
jgi:tetratricopeptide (TPR) repeat protein